MLIPIKEALVEELKSGVFTIEFTKVDGTPAVMEATLDPKWLPPGASYSSKPGQDETVSVYSLDRQGWRSFKVANLKSLTPNLNPLEFPRSGGL